MSALNEFAQAVREAVSSAVEAEAQNIQLARVRTVEPLVMELLDTGIILDEDEVYISQGVRGTIANEDIQPDDLALVIYRSNRFVVVELLTNTNPKVYRQVGESGGGGDDKSYRHPPTGVQSAATSWLIEHGLNKKPSVLAYDVNGVSMFYETINYPSETTTIIDWGGVPVAGFAICN